MNTFVIGDIHGGLRALKQVLEEVNPVSTDSLIFLGDYVDGWSEASEVVDYLIELSSRFSCVFLKGNHDELCLAYLKDNDQNPMWLASGGLVTMNSYKGLSEAKRNEHITFFEALHDYHIDSQNRLFVHAGFTHVKGPAFEYYPRLVYWERTLWEMACSLDPTLIKTNSRYPKRLALFEEIYIGHTPTTRLGKTVPLNYANVWNIDTGAAFLGPLTILDVATKEFWQSDPVWKLYPEEQGRN